MGERGKLAGTCAVVRFNWPLYAAALGVLVILLPAGILATGLVWKTVALLLAAGAAWFLTGSLAASHVTYDRSDLHRGAWLDRVLPAEAREVAVCHCGYDEISGLVRRKRAEAEVRILDHYDEATMSEPSIHRARRLYPPGPDTVAAPHGAWPVEDGMLDSVLGILAIHEIRKHEERRAWFLEARRCLAAGGRVVVMEHLRDAANFAAFGPGFMHFHSAATWRRSWEAAGLKCGEEFSVSPFVRVFVLSRHD